MLKRDWILQTLKLSDLRVRSQSSELSPDWLKTIIQFLYKTILGFCLFVYSFLCFSMSHYKYFFMFLIMHIFLITSLFISALIVSTKALVLFNHVKVVYQYHVKALWCQKLSLGTSRSLEIIESNSSDGTR